MQKKTKDTGTVFCLLSTKTKSKVSRQRTVPCLALEWIFTDTASSAHATITNHGNGRATLTSTGTTFYSSLKLRAQSTETVSSYYRKDIEVDVSALSEDYYFISNKETSLYMNPDDSNTDCIKQFKFQGDETKKWFFEYCGDDNHSNCYYIKDGNNYIYATGLNSTIKSGSDPSNIEKAHWNVTRTGVDEYTLQSKSLTNNGFIGINDSSDTDNSIYLEGESTYEGNVWKISNALGHAHLILPAKIYYDDAILSYFTHDQIVEAYQTASEIFTNLYYIKFDLIDASKSNLLNVDLTECDNPSGICSDSCGVTEKCLSLHHKNADRLLNFLHDDNYYVCRVVGIDLCRYRSNTHVGVNGCGDPNGKNIIISGNVEELQLVYTIVHELAHNLGTEHDFCAGGKCAMVKEYYDYESLDDFIDSCWFCDVCKEKIINNY